MQRAIAAVGAPTLVGAVLDDPDGTQHTSAILFDGSGQLAGRYDKVHLVPFGEYVPWRDELSWISAIQQIPVDRTPGERVHTLSTAGLPAFGTPICFENSFPELTRAFVRDGAGFLVVPVNNASYGTTAASAQHLQMSRMRAVEDGRWVVDAAVSGISAFVDPTGRIVSQVGLFRTGDPAPHDPVIGRDHGVRPLRGLVPVALALRRRRDGAGAPPALERPTRPGARCRPTDAGRS